MSVRYIVKGTGWLLACAPLLASWACATETAVDTNRRGAGGDGATGGAGTGGTGAATGGSGPGSGGSGFGGSGFGGAGGAGGAGGSGATTSGCTAAPVGGTDGLIDDLEDGDDVARAVDSRTGYWFTFNDGTAGGVQTPAAGSFTPEAGGANGSTNAARTTGTGFAEWGGGMGVSFNTVGSLNCPYSATAFTGIEFWAKGTGKVRVMVGSDLTIPAAAGGSCAPEADCHNHHGKDITFTAEWQKYTIAWAELAQDPSWGNQVGAIDAAKVIQINFQAMAPFDFWIDDLAFSGGGGTPDAGGTPDGSSDVDAGTDAGGD